MGPFFVTASVLIFSSACCLSPINGVADLQNVGHQQRQKRAAVTPLGKRLTTKLVAELGTRPRHLYSFGIGKRSISSAEMEEYLNEEEQKEHKSDNNQDIETSKQQPTEDKLAKRDPYSFGLGKRGGDETVYSFGMGRKRDPYGFGLGKRDPYSFGLGKRDPYSFGLGKRSDKRDP